MQRSILVAALVIVGSVPAASIQAQPAVAGAEAKTGADAIHKLFRELDRDKSGGLSKSEYVDPAGAKFKAAAEQEFALFDADGDGQLSLLQFALTPRADEKSEEVFRLLDANSDGTLTRAEFVKPRPAPQWIGQGVSFLRLDDNHDGRLSRAEFLGDRSRIWSDPLLGQVEDLIKALEPVAAAGDRDGNGRLEEREWPAPAIAGIGGDLDEIPFKEWDRNGDGGVTPEERRLLVELAFGIRLTDGMLLRKPGGYPFNLSYVRIMDKNHDGVVSKDEFIAAFWEGAAKNAERFGEWNKDGDDRLALVELLNAPAFYPDPLYEFCRFDVDFDGRISKDELTAQAAPWQKGLVQHLIPAFDRNGDGGLSPDELVFSPFANPVADWFAGRADADNDGRLSWQEFYAEQSPLFYGLARHFFRSFDRNGDSFLTLDEYGFTVDAEKGPLEIKYAIRDADGDGRLSREEYYAPHIGGQWEQAARNEALQHDLDKDGFLSLLEFAMTPHGATKSEVLFRLLDSDKSGALTRTEFLQATPKEQWLGVATAFYRSDTDGDGVLSLDEYLHQGEPGQMRPDPLVRRVADILKSIAIKSRDGRVTARDWPASEIERTAPELNGLSFADWDANRDGTVSIDERRLVAEMAFGIRRADGWLLRQPEIRVFNLAYIHNMDKNHDDTLSRDEFVAGFWEGGAKNIERFKEWDKNGDGRLTFDELHVLSADPIYEFCRFDTNFDGRVTNEELLSQSATWQKKLAPRLVLAFDLDGGGALELDEYLMTPFANPIADWYVPRADKDYDGKLSWEEYYAEKAPFLYGISRFYFLRFDRDGDGFLSPAELEFQMEIDKVPAEAVFAIRDTDGDGRLVFAEVFTEPQPAADNPRAQQEYKGRMIRAEGEFMADDKDGDGGVTLAEFTRARERRLGAAAAVASRSPQARAALRESRSNWTFWGFIVVDGCIVIAVAGYFLTRSRTGNNAS
jgi:Ca2+-binding EF-hand superfamily protein